MDFIHWLFGLAATDEFRGVMLTLGVFVAVVSVRSARTVARKKQTADALFASRADTRLVEGLKCVSKLYEADDANIRSFGKIEKQGSVEVDAMLYVLNHFEFVSIGLQAAIYDEAMFRASQWGTVTRLWEKAAAFVDEMRKSRGQATMFQELEWLAARWIANPLGEKKKRNLLSRIKLRF